MEGRTEEPQPQETNEQTNIATEGTAHTPTEPHSAGEKEQPAIASDKPCTPVSEPWFPCLNNTIHPFIVNTISPLNKLKYFPEFGTFWHGFCGPPSPSQERAWQDATRYAFAGCGLFGLGILLLLLRTGNGRKAPQQEQDNAGNGGGFPLKLHRLSLAVRLILRIVAVQF